MPRNNPSGTNQHSKGSLLKNHPNLPQLIQQHLNQNALQKDIPNLLLEDDGIQIGLRSVESIIKKFSLRTTRQSGLTEIDKGAAILTIIAEDPLGRWGSRSVKEKLRLQGYHVSREFINAFQRQHDPVAVAARHPLTRKVHTSTLWSAGPNEEWCVDGHEKLVADMGIAIWGIVDKWSRLELCLRAVPNARDTRVPIALYLQTVKECGGMPSVVAADKGTELGPLLAAQGVLRQLYLPDLDIETVPPFRTVKSVYNITRERAWHPLLENHLRNIQHEYHHGRIDGGYHPNDLVHKAVATWLWAKIVQARLDIVLEEHKYHVIRKQKKTSLPSGKRRIDFYKQPEEWNGTHCLIKVPETDIDRLIAEHADHEVLQFGSDETVAVCEQVYQVIGSPNLVASEGWNIFRGMIEQMEHDYSLS